MRRLLAMVVAASMASVAAAGVDGPGLRVRSEPGATVVELQLPEVRLSTGPVSELAAFATTSLEVTGFLPAISPGLPALPSKGLLLALPPGAAVRLEIDEASFHEIEGVWIDPPAASESRDAELAGPRFERRLDAEVYATDDFFPSQVVRLRDRGVARDVDFAVVELTPFQWNPVSRRLRVYDRLRFRVHHGALADETARRRDPQTSPSGERQRINGAAARRPSSPRPDAAFVNAPVPAAWYVRRESDEIERLRATRNPAASGLALKLEVSSDGLYGVPATNLAAAGLMLPVAIDSLALMMNGEAVAFHVRDQSGDGQLDPGDTLVFHGRGNRGRYSSTHVYWLTTGGGGVRAVPGAGLPPDAPSYGDVVSGRATAVWEENERLFDATGVHPREWTPWVSNTRLYSFCPLPGDASCPVGVPPLEPVCLGQPASSEVTLGLDARLTAPPSASSTYELRMTIVSEPRTNCVPAEQEIEVFLNGVSLGSEAWDVDFASPLQRELRLPVDASLVVEGVNDVRLLQPILEKKLRVLSVDSIRLDYQRRLRAESGRLVARGTWSEGAMIHAAGFASRDLEVFNLRADGRVTRIADYAVTSLGPGTPLTISLALPPSRFAHELVIAEAGALLAADAIYADTPSTLRDPASRGSYSVVSHARFLDEIQPLLDDRVAGGLSARAIDVQDVYDEFSWGHVDADAIRDFVAWTLDASDGWAEPPLYVVLVGDTTDDYRDHRGFGVELLLPHGEHVKSASGVGRLISSDAFFATVVGADPVPDVLIGRLAAQTEAEVTNYVTKLLGYEARAAAPWQRRSLVVVDDHLFDVSSCNDPAQDQGEAFLANLVCCYLGNADPTDVTHLELDLLTWPECHDAVIDAREQGVSSVLYYGHGAVTKWGKCCDSPFGLGDIYGASDVIAQANVDALPISTSCSCNVGRVDWVEVSGLGSRCLGEAATMVSTTGEIAFIASSTTTSSGVAAFHAAGYADALWNPSSVHLPPFPVPQSRRRAGSIHFAAQLGIYLAGSMSATDEDSMRSLILFGDPSALLAVDDPPAPQPECCPEPDWCPNYDGSAICLR